MTKKKPSRKDALAALKLENERAILDMIRRWQALPPGKRTHFLRKRIRWGVTAL